MTLTWDQLRSGALADSAPLGLSIGVFDGVHLGHRALLARAFQPGLRPCAITFAGNPKRAFAASPFADLATERLRLELLVAAGAEVIVLIDFSEDFSKLSGRDFLSLLARSAPLGLAVIGEDFRCGYRNDTDSRAFAAFASTLGIATETLSPLSVKGRAVSSSLIRGLVASGELSAARELLGRGYALDLRGLTRSGSVVDLGGFAQVLPPVGAYACAEGLGDDGRPCSLLLEGGRARVSGDAEILTLLRREGR
jgi:riboflavin kinase / FMN adenylyltransferase